MSSTDIQTVCCKYFDWCVRMHMWYHIRRVFFDVLMSYCNCAMIDLHITLHTCWHFSTKNLLYGIRRYFSNTCQNTPSPSRMPGMVGKHAASTENICNSPSSKWSYYSMLNLRLHLFWNMPHTHSMCFKVCSYPDSNRFIYSRRPHPCIFLYICVHMYIFSSM